MAQFSQRFIRSIIRQVWNQAKAGANTFRDALNLGQTGQWQNVGTGWTVQASSGAGYSTSFHIPSTSDDPVGLTPQALQELFENILEIYGRVRARGIVEEDTDIDAMDSKFIASMWSYFPTIKGRSLNWMYLAS